MQRDMDEYIDQLLAEMSEPTQTNILDEPIPRAVKQGLLKPLLLGKPRPSRHLASARTGRERRSWRRLTYSLLRRRLEQSRTTSKTFWKCLKKACKRRRRDTKEGVQAQKKRHEQVFYRTPWVIGNFLRGWQMDISKGHPSGVDVRDFLQEMRPQIHKKLTEEILALNGIKFQLALKVQLQKERVQLEEESLTLCSATNRRPFSRPAKSKRLLTKPSPTSWTCSKSGHKEGPGGWSTECRLSGWTSLDMSH